MNFANYIMMALGIFIVLIASIMIFLDKLKGEDIYFNIDMKEQELKKTLEDADEVISEINYISEVVVKEIEDKINDLQEVYKYAKTLNIPTYEQLVNTRVENRAEPRPAPRVEHIPEPEPVPVQKIEPQPVVKPEIKLEHHGVPLTKEALDSKKSLERTNAPVSKDDKISVKQKAVFEYAAQGLGIPEIAKKMNMGQGEVMLILSIKNEVQP